jgi:hypothetical protein
VTKSGYVSLRKPLTLWLRFNSIYLCAKPNSPEANDDDDDDDDDDDNNNNNNNNNNEKAELFIITFISP